MTKRIILVIGIIVTIIITIGLFNRKAIVDKIKSNHIVLIKLKKIYNVALLKIKPEKKESVEKLTECNVNITVDASVSIGTYKRFYSGIGMGIFKDGVLKAHNKEFFKLVTETNRKVPFIKYVNMKCIFVDKPKKWGRLYGGRVVHKNDTGDIYYNWNIVDSVLDTLISGGFKPIISLTFMPKLLALDTCKMIPWNKGITSPPKNYTQWQELIYRTVKHLKQRYGSEEIQKWYFEVWNEPDLYKWFWRPHPNKKKYPKVGDFDEYCKLYDYTVQGALSADSKIKIGGPGLAGHRLFLRKFLIHCNDGINYVTGAKGTRIDFISRHHYGNIENRILPKYINFVEEIRGIFGEKFNDLQLLITETGPSASTEYWLNNRYSAAWLVKQLDAFFYVDDKNKGDYFPDIVCFWTKPVSYNFGKQFGLVTALGRKTKPSPKALIKRAVFNGYEAISCLGEERIKISGSKYGDPIHAIATKKSDSSIQVIIYHLNESDINNQFEAEHTVKLKLKGIKYSKYSLEYYKIDRDYSNGYTIWNTLDKPKFPSQEQLKLLQDNDDLMLYEPVTKISTINKSFSKTIKMMSNSVVLLIFTPNEE